MIVRILLATSLAAGMLVPAANALTLTNSDKAIRMITVMPNGGRMQHITLKGHHSASVNCVKGCELATGKQKASFDAKTMKVWIKKGKFVTS